MIVEIAGTILVPGNFGKDCPGNGESPGVECCCDECDYMLCCRHPAGGGRVSPHRTVTMDGFESYL